MEGVVFGKLGPRFERVENLVLWSCRHFWFPTSTSDASGSFFVAGTVFTPLRVGWPPTPQVYLGPWEGLRVVFPPWGLPKLRILTSPPVGAPQAREFSLFPPVGAPQAREFSLFPPVGAPQAREFSLFPPVGAPQAREFSNFHFSPPWQLPKLWNFHFSLPWRLSKLRNFK